MRNESDKQSTSGAEKSGTLALMKYKVSIILMMDEIIINVFFFLSCCNHYQDPLDE